MWMLIGCNYSPAGSFAYSLASVVNFPAQPTFPLLPDWFKSTYFPYPLYRPDVNFCFGFFFEEWEAHLHTHLHRTGVAQSDQSHCAPASTRWTTPSIGHLNIIHWIRCWQFQFIRNWYWTLKLKIHWKWIPLDESGRARWLPPYANEPPPPPPSMQMRSQRVDLDTFLIAKRRRQTQSVKTIDSNQFQFIQSISWNWFKSATLQSGISP